MTMAISRFFCSTILFLALFCLSACGEEKAEQSGTSTAPAGTAPMESGEKADGVKDDGSTDQSGKAPAGAAPSGKTAENGENREPVTASDEDSSKDTMPPSTEKTMSNNQGKGGIPVEKDLLHRRFELQAINGKEYALKEKKPALSLRRVFN